MRLKRGNFGCLRLGGKKIEKKNGGKKSTGLKGSGQEMVFEFAALQEAEEDRGPGVTWTAGWLAGLSNASSRREEKK